MAGTAAAKEAIWTKNFANHLHLPEYYVDGVPLKVDNKTAIKTAKNSESHQRTKHTLIKHNFIREWRARREH